MRTEQSTSVSLTEAERKKELIARGAAFRAGIVKSRDGIYASLRPETIARSAIGQVRATLLAAVTGRGDAAPSDADLQAMLPLLISGISSLSKMRSLRKPLLRGAAIVGAACAAGAVVALAFKIRDARSRTPPARQDGPGEKSFHL